MEMSIQRMIDELGTEHRALLGAVRAVEADLEGPAITSTGNLARKLRALADICQEHSEQEERSEVMTWFMATFDDLRADMERLNQEHAPMLAAVREQAKACESARKVELMSPLAIAIRSAVAALRVHEAAESALVRRAADRSTAKSA